jgi:two-component system, chemotaxis family, chemotaxis protein CheY
MLGNQDKELKIVVVDDSEFSRKSIIELLEANDYNVVGQAGNAETGVALSATTKANLFIIDIVMPERSGLELAKILTEKSMGCSIIMMSSLNIESVVIEAISNGAIDFIPKPFSPNEFIKAVEKIEIELKKD